MAGIDDIDCSNLFHQIDDLLDIPDETCTNNSNADNDFFLGDFKDFSSIWSQSDDFTRYITNSEFYPNRTYSASDLSVPYEDIDQLEWLSKFIDNSFSNGCSLTTDVPSTVVSPSPTQFQTSSPVSDLESSGSSYVGGSFVPAKFGRCGRGRSERPRPPTFNRRRDSFTIADLSECESLCDLSKNINKSASNREMMKKKKLRMPIPAEVDQNDDPNPLIPHDGEVRKCQHCEITKTPQWRAGPNGPKTLCNACGVRYKSGRLFPEYRPAASPTFVPSIHSNSHKKILEMRVKTRSNLADSPLNEENSYSENVPNKNSLLDYM